jgi:hypothetical protein
MECMLSIIVVEVDSGDAGREPRELLATTARATPTVNLAAGAVDIL